MPENFSRGSEWRKWDLHVHSPKSFLNNQFGTTTTEQFIQQIVDAGIKVVGLTNYFRFADGELTEIKTALEAHGIVVFPNLEFRIKPENRENEDMHIHVIFSDKVEPEIINDFLTRLKTCNDKYCANLTNQDIENSTISLDTLITTLKADSSITKEKDYFVIACPRGQGSFRPEAGEGRGKETAITVDKRSDILFGKAPDVEFFLNPNRYPGAKTKPVFCCSDAHRTADLGSNFTWVKADTTFLGLQQVVYHPNERVYIGALPPKLEKVARSKNTHIDKVSIQKNEVHRGDNVWFNANIPINPGLTTIIGNKGSGKSALSDIIGHLCKCNTMKDASFLESKRFRKSPENLADKYKATLTWADNNITEQPTLGEVDYGTTIPDAQYLPQKYIEKVCNDLNEEFQKEIDKVIFSYIDATEKGEAKNLKELISIKSNVFDNRISEIKVELHDINSTITLLESRLTASYKKTIEDNLKKRKSDLERYQANKPKEVKKPEVQEDAEYVGRLKQFDTAITKVSEEIKSNSAILTKINKQLQAARDLKEKATNIAENITKFNASATTASLELGLQEKDLNIVYSFPETKLLTTINALEDKRQNLLSILCNIEEDVEGKSLYTKKDQLEKEKGLLVSKASSKEKEYQKFLLDIKDWEKQGADIVGDEKTDNSITYFTEELKKIADAYPSEYNRLKKLRQDKLSEIYAQKVKKANVYTGLYTPIETTIGRILGGTQDNINFKTNFLFKEKDLPSKIAGYINLRVLGKFYSKEKAFTTLSALVQQTDCNNLATLIKFVEDILQDIYDDLDKSSLKVADKTAYYDFLTSLDYVDIEYNLRMGNTTLEELSPGEKGILLLVFYLALNKEETPLIIDQPEDNLDNQSVYNRLVPAICEAKRRRQVIIVTHNPNIAIACDAEQIIYSHMDKASNLITYESGSIENPKIRQHIIDVLEGTEPAFDLRTLKYSMRKDYWQFEK